MKYKIGLVLILLTTIFVLPTSVLYSAENQATAGFIDLRQVLLQHPLMQNFDLHSRRFQNTSSAWVANPQEARDRYTKELAQLEAQQRELTQKMKNMPGAAGGKPSPQLQEAWNQLSETRVKIDSIKSAIEATTISGNYLYGASTGIESLVPIVRSISKDIQTMVRKLSARYGNIPILDLSCFQPPASDPGADRSILVQNRQALVWRGNTDARLLKEWVTELRCFLRQEYPQRFSHPFLCGFLDLRQEAVSSLQVGTP